MLKKEYIKTITPRTTIEDLYRNEVISTRVHNVLVKIGVFDVLELWNYVESGKQLLEVKNFGQTSEEEIKKLLEIVAPLCHGINIKKYRYEELDADIRGRFEQTVGQETFPDNKVGAYLHQLYPDTWMLYNAVINTPQIAFQINPDFTISENMVLRKWHLSVLKKFRHEIETLPGNHSELFSIMDDCIPKMEIICTTMPAEDILKCYVPEHRKKYIVEAYNALCKERLGARELHFLIKQTKSYEDLVALFGKPLDNYSELCRERHCRQTLKRLYEFNKEFRELYLKLIQMDDEGLVDTEMKREYPYLSHGERLFVENFINSYGHYPIFYLLIVYLSSSDDKRDVMFGMHCGIVGNRERPNDEISKMFGLTRERVRQIVAKRMSELKGKVFTDRDLSFYKTLFELPFIAEDTPEVLAIMNKEGLICTFRIFSLIVKYFFDFCFLDNDISSGILVNKKLLEDVNLSDILDNLQKTVNAKYSENTKVYVQDIVGCIPAKYSSAVKEFIIYIAKRKFDLEPCEDNFFILHRNFVNVEAEIVSILKKEGKPMHIDKLFDAFKQKFPNHHIDKAKHLSNNLHRGRLVHRIGLSCNYALTEWKEVNFGSMLQIAYDTLDASTKPLHFDSIMQKVQEAYPNAKAKNIRNMMQSDHKCRFVELENHYFGLVGKKYSVGYNIHMQPKAEDAFEKRLEQFRNFIEKNHRFPNEKDNRVLCRWHQRLLNSPDKEHLRQLMKVEKSYEKYNYPKTATEHSFLCKCESYKEFVKQHHALPNKKEGECLYGWFWRNKRKHEKYQDSRKKYFESLLVFLKENQLIK